MPADVIDTLVGVVEGSAVDRMRRQRPVTREHAQASWSALFEPKVPAGVTLKERWAVALFVTAVSGDPEAADFYRAGLFREGGGDWGTTVEDAALAGVTQGPYGRWAHHTALAAEGTDGLRYEVATPLRDRLGTRLAAALDHAHLLVFRPREAAQSDLASLASAGWSETDIVTLSQLAAFLSFQLRVTAGFRVLQESLQ